MKEEKLRTIQTEIACDSILAFVTRMLFRDSETESNTVKSNIHDSCSIPEKHQRVPNSFFLTNH